MADDTAKVGAAPEDSGIDARATTTARSPARKALISRTSAADFQPSSVGARPCESLRDLSGICPIFAIALLPLTVWRPSGWVLGPVPARKAEEGYPLSY